MKMNMWVLLVMAIVIMGVALPAAHARQGSDDSSGSSDDDGTADQGSGDMNDSSGSSDDDGTADQGSGDVDGSLMVGVNSGKGKSLLGRVDDKGREIRGDIKEAREDIKDARRDVRDRIRDVRDRIKDMKDQYKDNREALVNAKLRVSSECKRGSSETCTQIRSEFSLKAQDFLLSASAKIGDHLDRLQAYVETNVENGTVQADLLADIQGVQDELDLAIAAVEDLPDNATADELKDARDGIQQVWKDTLDLTKKVQKSVVEHKVKKGSDKMVNLEARLIAIRDKLETNGANVTDLDALLDEYSAELDAAAAAENATESRTHFTSAVHLLREIMQEIRDLTKGVRDDMRAEGSVNANVGVSDDDGTADQGSGDADGDDSSDSSDDDGTADQGSGDINASVNVTVTV